MSEAAKKAIMRIRLAITKALLKGVDDTTPLQLVKMKMETELPAIERLQSYGLTSNPPLESESIVVEVGGTRDNLVALVIDSAANRIKDLLLGETCFYSMHGQTIKHDENGDTLHTATTHKFNDGGRSGARVDDTTQVNAITDTSFIGWIATMSAAINALAPGTITNIPVTIEGEITSGSSSVELPND